MRKSIYLYAMLLVMPLIAIMTSCEPRELTENDVFTTEDQVAELTADGRIYGLNEFLDTFMTEKGDFGNDTTPYRDRSYDATHGIYLYSVDTIPTDTIGIYIRVRVVTDDYAGNFYKAMVIQQIGDDGKQQTLRISVDLGNSHGMYQMGQEILIRCNGLAIGRYANQPQLCIPSYNNNIYASKAAEKVGWCPGRIEGSVFRNATHMIGKPDASAIQYDEITLATLYTQIQRIPEATAEGMDAVRKMDGRLVRLKDVHFTGQYDNNGTLTNMVAGNPDPGDGESHSEINVFAPTTGNLNFPQSRVLGDQGSNTLMCSSSEYAKFAFYYLPGADKNGVTNCKNYEGTVTGILGWYLDKASELANSKLDGYEWSVTPRGIPGVGVADIQMYFQGDKESPWVPTEYDPKAN